MEQLRSGIVLEKTMFIMCEVVVLVRHWVCLASSCRLSFMHLFTSLIFLSVIDRLNYQGRCRLSVELLEQGHEFALNISCLVSPSYIYSWHRGVGPRATTCIMSLHVVCVNILIWQFHPPLPKCQI